MGSGGMVGLSQAMKVGGASGGPVTTVSLAGTQSIPDSMPTALVWDGASGPNLVAGVPTVPADGDYWVNVSSALVSTGVAGILALLVTSSLSGDIDADVTGPGLSDTDCILSVTKLVTLQAGDELSAGVYQATGVAADAGGSAVDTFLQFWAA